MSLTPEEAREKTIDALENGRVIFPEGAEESLATIGKVDRDDPEFGRIDNVKLSCWGPVSDDNRGGFSLEWTSHGVGFGSTTIWVLSDGRIKCDNETMSLKFVKSVLCALADKMTLID